MGILDIHPVVVSVFCAVYRLRHLGQELERDVVRHNRALGELVYTERLHDPRPGRSVMAAMLLGADGESYVVPVLDQARVLRIRGKGVLIAGIEVVPRGRGAKIIKADRFRQTWWCVPAAPRDGQPFPRAEPLCCNDFNRSHYSLNELRDE